MSLIPGRKTEPGSGQVGVDDEGRRGLRAIRQVVAKLGVDVLVSRLQNIFVSVIVAAAEKLDNLSLTS